MRQVKVAAKVREDGSLVKWSTGLALGLLGVAATLFIIKDAHAQAASGEQVFTTVGCSGCHNPAGTGSLGGDAPALAGNGNLSDVNHVINQILKGSGAMPPFAATLSDDQIAAVANYIRSSWGNSYTPMITTAQVTAARAAP